MRRYSVLLAVLLTLLMGGETAIAASAPVTADGFTSMFASKNDMQWSGSDQMTSLKVGTRVYWSSGDTILGTQAADGAYSPGAKMVGNHLLLQTGSTLANAMANAGQLVNPDGVAVADPPTHTAANNERYWTQGMFSVNGFLYVLCQRVVNNAAGGFDLVGVELARYSINATTGKLTQTGMLVTPATGVHGGVGPALTQWGADAVVSGAYVYIYGYSNAADPYAPQRTYVARVASASVENPSAWRYYDGAIWGTSLPAAQPLVHSQVSSVRLVGTTWVMLHKPWNGYGADVYKETGPNPYGPFTSTKIFSSPSGTWEGKNYLTYGPMLHPEQALATGKMLVSIDWNGKDFFEDTMGNADLYKPRFMEVTVP